MDTDERITAATVGSGNPSPLPPLAPPPSFIPLFTSPSPRRPPPIPLLNGHAQIPLPATPSSDDEDDLYDSHKKQKATPSTAAKKPKKKTASVWSTTTRKTKKKPKPSPSPLPTSTPAADRVLITPVPKPPSLTDDSPSAPILLSRVYKADKVDLSDDRLTAGSTLGFRMVRATRGVATGAWYFEIRILAMGESGHARLGWTTDKGDLQAPVGFDANSFGYRDVDGTKVHKAMREDFGGEGFGEGDVVGFYISLPDGEMYAPKPPQLVFYKGQKFMVAPDAKDDPPKVIPGSEMSFFKNGVCQGVAFTDLFGGRYYPAASMYTLPNQPNCEVRFNFGPDFEFFPEDFGGRPTPRPMVEVPYLNQDIDGRVDAPAENGLHTEEASSGSLFRSASMRA